jgi:uncharacterized membrane protein YoaK (UPF0700 family)
MQRHANAFRARALRADSLLGLQLLTAVLSLTAGSLDVITFLGPDRVFTAHVTANIVLTAAQLAGGDPLQLAALLSLPVFMLGLCLTRLLAEGLEAIGYATPWPLLLLQFLLLSAFLALAVGGQAFDTTAKVFTVGALLGVFAMAVQNALVQVSLKGAPSTAVMTTNVVRLTMDVGTLLLRDDRNEKANARDRVNKTWPSIGGYAVGCILGAICETRFDLHSLLLPTFFSLVVLGLAMAGERARTLRSAK